VTVPRCFALVYSMTLLNGNKNINEKFLGANKNSMRISFVWPSVKFGRFFNCLLSLCIYGEALCVCSEALVVSPMVESKLKIFTNDLINRLLV
jgi:hypothetical protein